jgi:hypothetical protein
MHRGLAPGQEQAGVRPEPTAPGGRRLPSAPRERKPALAALALLLIVGGALGAAYLVTQNAKRIAAIEISAQVGAGQKIPLSAMREVQIAANSNVHYVQWSQAAQVSQFYAASAIPPGTLLNGGMVVRASAVTKGKDVVGLSLKAGEVPDNLAIGDHIDVFDVNQGTSQCPGRSGQALTTDAVVLAVGAPPSSTGNTDDVIVALTQGTAGAVTCNAANGIVGIAVLPGGGAAPSATAPIPAPSASTPVSGQTTPARPHRHRGGHTSPNPSPSGGTG